LQKLINKQWNGRIKVLTGIRRCGKSTILFDLFYDYLIKSGVKKSNIIKLALDDDENEAYRDPHELSQYIKSECCNPNEKYYVFLDEVQFAISKAELKNPDVPVRLYSVLNSLLHKNNIDVYVTGSNSKMLSKDVSTEFRGRGDTVHIYPLSFHEFYDAAGMSELAAYNTYMTYGGMPYLLQLKSDSDKYDYLNSLFEEIYFKDIEECYAIQLPGVLRDLTDDLCSSVGSLTSANKIVKTVKSTKNLHTNTETITKYLNYLQESFLFSKAARYDVKGKRYFEYPSKYYCTDIGLRNVRLHLRQMDETHIMENMIYNELLVRGYAADVGVVEVTEKNTEGKRVQKNLEVDFIARMGGSQYYIQSAINMDEPEKEKQELRSLLAIPDSFKKVVVSKSYGSSWQDDHGIFRMNIIDFLLDDNSLNR
jgi:predicted AAA+ superfamily ATPase